MAKLASLLVADTGAPTLSVFVARGAPWLDAPVLPRREAVRAELPPSVAGRLRDELEAWKPDVAAIARRHRRNMSRTD
jgi:hypothetical protein